MDYRVARILRFGIFIILFIILLALFYFGIRAIGNGLKSNPTQAQQPLKLTDFTNNGSQVRLINDGPIVAAEDHIVITVSVNATQRTIEVSKGYNQAPTTIQSFANNEAGYSSFLSALNSAGFTLTKPAPVTVSRTGSCPLGNRFSYQLVPTNGSLRIDSWNNSCGNLQGTINGKSSLIRTLFQRQIPDYSSIVSAARQ